MKNIYFSPGPSEMHYNLHYLFKHAIKEEIFSLSHRSKTFEKIYQETVEKLKVFLEIPDDYMVFFAYSTAEIYERIAIDLIAKNSLHFVTGKYSEKFAQIVSYHGHKAESVKGKKDEIPNINHLILADHFDVLAVTLNDLSVGVSFPFAQLYELGRAFPESLLMVDATSGLPYYHIDYHKVDSVFFDLHYGWGLPSGLAVWIVNQRVIEKTQKLKAKSSYNTINSLINFYHKAKNNQTPYATNVIGIYLLSKILDDFINTGLPMIRRDANYKAALIYHLLDNHSVLKPFVNLAECRSKTVVTAKTSMPSNELFAYLAKKKLILGTGYGEYKFKHLRIANYPLHSKEQFEMLVDLINTFYD